MDASAIPFETCAGTPPLADDEVHVWFFSAPADARPAAVAIAARGVRDRLLCAYAGCARPPSIEHGAHGKPFAPQLPDFHFNLSHAGSHVLLAFARAQPIGVDLECHNRRVSFDDIARRFFAPAEADALERVAPALRPSAFLGLWTNKEAVLKALGEGLNFGLDRVEFSVDDAGDIGALRRIPVATGRPHEWVVHRLEPARGLVGALAWRGPPRRVRAFITSGDDAQARRSAPAQRP